MVGWVAKVSRTQGELYEQFDFFIPKLSPSLLEVACSVMVSVWP